MVVLALGDAARNATLSWVAEPITISFQLTVKG